MNKQQFMNQLQKHLAPMSAHERRELLSEYENHFHFGIENGRSEEEIALELGDPVELAKEALGDRYVNPDSMNVVGVESSRTIFSLIMIFFVNLFMVPVGISFWAVVLSLGVTGLALILSPLLVFIEVIWTHTFAIAKLFAAIGCTGIGILLSIGMYYTAIGLWKITRYYFRWNVAIVKGSR